MFVFQQDSISKCLLANAAAWTSNLQKMIAQIVVYTSIKKTK